MEALWVLVSARPSTSPPASLDWERTSDGYSDLLHFLLTGDVPHFYGGWRWPGWEDEVRALEPDSALSLYPPPWTKEGKDVARSSRRRVPVAELYRMHLDAARQLNEKGPP